VSDLGGSHSWLLDVGGGVEREAVRADVGAASRPSDAELEALLGAPPRARETLGDRVERLTTDDGAAILKYGGFQRRSVELSLYQRVLVPTTDGSPRLLAAAPARDFFLLEDLGPAEPVDLEDGRAVEAVFGRLAKIHRAHAGADLEELSAAPLSAREPSAYAAAARALAELVARAGRDGQVWEIGPAERGHAARLVAWADEAGPALAATGPVTLLHGDFQRRNWLMRGGEARVLDWEMAALGPGVLDLFYLSPDGPGAGHAPAGAMAERAMAVYGERAGARLTRGRLREAVVWGGLTGALARLRDFYADQPLTRTPRGQLPAAAAGLLAYAARLAG
jgi:hypothetical protein